MRYIRTIIGKKVGMQKSNYRRQCVTIERRIGQTHLDFGLGVEKWQKALERRPDERWFVVSGGVEKHERDAAHG